MIFVHVTWFVIAAWAGSQVRLAIQTYRDINSLEGLNNGSDDSDGSKV